MKTTLLWSGFTAAGVILRPSIAKKDLHRQSDRSDRAEPRVESLPDCEGHLTQAEIIAPGVGFDLSLSYGTVAVKLQNGSTVDVGRVPASSEYAQLMIRLSDQELYQQHLKSTYLNALHSSLSFVLDFFPTFSRSFNPTPQEDHDSNILAGMLLSLASLTNETLSLLPTSVMLSTPSLPGLTPPLIRHALSKSNLRQIPIGKHRRGLGQLSAAFAGSGYGLCATHTDAEQCLREERDLARAGVLLIEFSESVLRVSTAQLQSVYQRVVEHSETRRDLGLKSLPAKASDQPAFWEEIQSVINATGRHVSPRGITHLLLVGDAASKPFFLKSLRVALDELFILPDQIEPASVHMPTNIQDGHSAMFLAARGAAELAKREQESTRRCRRGKNSMEAHQTATGGQYTQEHVDEL